MPKPADARGRGEYQTAEEYLSGNVREKLVLARLFAKDNPEYADNVKALEAAQPEPLQATEIDVRLGSTWVPPEYVEQFMHELLETPTYARSRITVAYSERITVAYSERTDNSGIFRTYSEHIPNIRQRGTYQGKSSMLEMY